MFLFELCGGNPGAITFVIDACNKNMAKSMQAFDRMQANNIVGDKLYMLWNDCCNRDTTLALDIACTAPIDKIIEHINYHNGRGFEFTDHELDSFTK